MESGEFFVLLGPSGSGKTVTVETVLGFHTPDSGKVLVSGRDVTGLPLEKRNFSYLPQDVSLFPNMSCKDNILYSIRYRKPDPLGDGKKWKQRFNLLVEVLEISHLLELWEATSPEDAEVRELVEKVHSTYKVEGVEESDIISAARVAVAMKRLVRRFRLDGLALLGQHYVEAKTKTTSYLGMAELHEEGKSLAVTEGDVLGLIMMKIMRHFTRLTPLFIEWNEFDVQRNAMMLAGHGFADPTQAKKGTVPRIAPSPEQWGFEGKGFSFEMTMDAGPVTFGHFICDAKGWRMFISGGEVMDLPTIPIHEVSVVVKVDRPIKEYVEMLTKGGFAHHCITVRGDVRKQLSQLADLMGMEKTFI